MTRLPRVFARPTCAPRRPRSRSRKLAVLNLEDRSVPATFTVANANDTGAGSLRQAILDANGAATNDTIVFDAAAFATPQTITLASSLPSISSTGGNLTITGPGKDRLTVDGAGAFGVMSSFAPNLTLTGFTIANGNTTGGGGGLHTSGVTRLDGMVIRDSHATGTGGGVFVEYQGFLSVKNTTISGNSSAAGGGIYFYYRGGLTIENSTISGNTSTQGGPYAGYYGGGGVLFWGRLMDNPPAGFTPGTVVIRNSTIANNSTTDGSGGGVMLIQFSDTLQVQNSTVTGNSAGATGTSPYGFVFGGGGIRESFGTGTVTIANSIVSGNTSANGNDIISAGTTVNANYSAIGDSTGLTLSGSSGNNLAFGANLQLGALANNGGPTQTILPGPTSPVIDAGSNALVPTGTSSDQRGFGYTRFYSTAGTQVADIGSIEVQPPGLPAALGSGADVTTPGATTYTFTVTYGDPTGTNNGIVVATVINNNNAVRVTGPNGFDVPATFVSIDNPTNGTPRTATYSITPPGGSFDAQDSGLYSFDIQPNQVRDLDNNPVPAGSSGTFSVTIYNFTVMNADDSGFGSLRQVLDDVASDPEPDTVTFDPAFFSTPQVIDLLSPLPVLNGGDVTINGPGASLVTVERSLAAATDFNIFNVAPTVQNTTIDGITIANGTTGAGAGITGNTFNLTIRNSVITGNSGGIGGAIYIPPGQSGLLTVQNTTITGNTGDTGGIYFWSGGNLLVENSTISNNVGTSGASYDGGGIVFYGPAGAFGVKIENSTIADNTTASSNGGGGLNLSSFSGAATIRNSTITGNTGPSSGGGGGVGGSGYGSLTVVNSVIAENVGNTSSPDLAWVGTGPLAGTGTNTFFSVAPTAGWTGTGDLTGDPLLGPLQDNGGPTFTRAPQTGSPLIDAGVPVPGLVFDQRGFGYVRSYNGTPDIGSLELQPPGIPFGIAGGLTDVTTPGGTSYTFTITYYDVTGPSNNAINVSTLIGNDAAVVARMPDGSTVPATFVSIDDATNGSPRTVTYSFTPPGGSWDFTEDGTVSVEVAANQVKDVENNPVPAGSVGTFRVLLPQNLVVTSADDSGPGTLREAIDKANDIPTDDTIAFDPALFATGPQTILLQSALTQLSATSGALSITGPGANKLTVDGGGAVRVLDSLAPTLTLSGFTITGGLAANEWGGGLRASGDVTIDHMVFTGNTATSSGFGFDQGGGGAIGMNIFSGTLTVVASTISGNSATNNGGGIFFRYGGSLVMDSSTVSGNSTSYSGTYQGFIGGGGIFLAGPGPTFNEITNSTIANNTTTGSGGGIFGNGDFNILLLQNSTVTGNSALTSGSGTYYYTYYFGGGGIGSVFGSTTTVLLNSIVSGNTNDTSPDIQSVRYPVYGYYSAVGDTNGFVFTGAVGNLIGQDLKLTGLADHGGPTQTVGFDPTSPLVDAGFDGLVPPGVSTDQRGLNRFFGGAVDIGSLEMQPPPVTIDQAATQADPTNQATINFTVTFGEPVTGFDATDVDLSGSTVGGTLVPVVTQTSSTTYNVAVTGMSGSGTVVATIPAGAATDDFALASLASTSTDNSVTFDSVAPTVTINQGGSQADPTDTDPVTFDVVFSEPVVGFDAADIDLTGSTIGGTLTPTVTQTGASSYTVTVTGMTGQGTIVASIPADAATDPAGNPSAASTSTDNSILFDGIAPTVTINKGPGQDDPTSNSTITFDVVFSEPVTGFDATDISFTGTTAGGTLTPVVTQTGATTYTVAVTGMTTRGSVVASIPAGAATDAAGNLSEASTSTDNSVEFVHAGVIGFSTTTVDTTEGSVVHLTLSRTGGSEGVVSVDLSALAGTAHAADFTLPAGTTVTWGDGDAADKVFDVTIVDDTANEGRENFTINLSNAVGGAVLGATSAAISIAPSDGKVIQGLPPKGQKPNSVFTDADGDLVTVALGGKAGTATVYLTDPDGDGHGPIEWIDLAGTDPAKSTLTISVKKPRFGTGDVRTTLAEVTGTGLKTLTAKTTDLIGTGIHPTGWIGAVTVGNISGGADIILTAAPPTTLKKPAVKITALVVGNGTDVTVAGAPLASLTATSFGDGTITAPAVGAITMKGKAKTKLTAAIPADFHADVNISGAGLDPLKGVALKSLRALGTVSGSTITVDNGNVGTVTVGSFVDSLLTAGYTGPVDGTGTFNNPSTVGPFIVKSKVNGFERSNVLATTIKPVTLASVDPVGSPAGTPFGFVAQKDMKGLVITNKAQKFKFDKTNPNPQGIGDFRVVDLNGPLFRRGGGSGQTSALTVAAPAVTDPAVGGTAAQPAPVVAAPAAPSLATYTVPQAFNLPTVFANFAARTPAPTPLKNILGARSNLTAGPGGIFLGTKVLSGPTGAKRVHPVTDKS